MDGDSDDDDYDEDMDDDMLYNGPLYYYPPPYAGPNGGVVIPPPSMPAYLAGLAGAASASAAGPSGDPLQEIDPFPPAWKAIRDLRGSKEEGWGLERLFLEFADPVPVHKQNIFFEGFWNLRYLATPASYAEEDNFVCPYSRTSYPLLTSFQSEFVESVARLPQLRYLYLISRRPPLCAFYNRYPPGYGPNFHLHLGLDALAPPMGGIGSQIPPTFNMPPRATPAGRRTSNNNKRKAKNAAPAEDPPDQAYIDALSIAAANRIPYLYTSPTCIHNGGKLEYIAVRAPVTPILYHSSRLHTARVFKIVIKKAPVKKVEVEMDEKSAERKRSLRSSTIKRRKIEEPGDWRVKREGDWEIRLEEVRDAQEKGEIAGGWFGDRKKDEVCAHGMF